MFKSSTLKRTFYLQKIFVSSCQLIDVLCE